MNVRLLTLCLAAGLSVSAAALADPPAGAESAKDQARKLADEGQRLFAAGDHRAAVERLREADSKFAAPTIKLAWAEAHEKLAELVEARAVYQRVVAEKLDASAPKAFVAAQEQASRALARLERVVPTLVLEIAGAPDGVTVTLDGAALPRTAWGEPVPVNPGAHTLSIERPGQPPEKRDMTLKEGETRHLQIRWESAGAAPVVSAHEQPPEASRRSWLLPGASFGVGGAGLVVGAIAGGLVLSRMDDFRKRCGPELQCPPELSGDLEGARVAGHVSTVGFALAGAGAALGGVLLLVPPGKSPQVNVGVGPSGVVVAGRF